MVYLYYVKTKKKSPSLSSTPWLQLPTQASVTEHKRYADKNELDLILMWAEIN